MWQEIDVVSTTQITGSSGNYIRSDDGTNIIEVYLDRLPYGMQWKVEIDPNAFHDEAGNTFEGWGTEESEYWFWSEKTATPVIRVERVTNNRATTAQAGFPDAILQTNVRYRIDCVTPGANIVFHSWNRGSSADTGIASLRGVGLGVARILTGAMTGGPYNASSIDGPRNSEIQDMNAAEEFEDLSLSLNPGVSYSLGSYIMGGSTTPYVDETTTPLFVTADLYTARKDYVGAIATKEGLDESSMGIEGIFKTLIIYRDVGGVVGGNFLKTEATNTRNGAVTIAGFPMKYNDMTGHGSKYVYRNGASNTNDWIWISWEIVSNFWHVAMTLPNAIPNTPLTGDPWIAFSEDWYNHNFRKYGNWGLRVGN